MDVEVSRFCLLRHLSSITAAIPTTRSCQGRSACGHHYQHRQEPQLLVPTKLHRTLACHMWSLNKAHHDNSPRKTRPSIMMALFFFFYLFFFPLGRRPMIDITMMPCYEDLHSNGDSHSVGSFLTSQVKVIRTYHRTRHNDM